MYRFSYAEILDESASLNREREGLALDHAIELLVLAQAAGRGSNEVMAAMVYLQRLWSFFIADLADNDNALPRDLRASLASLGLWVIQESDKVLAGSSGDLTQLIDVNRMIRDGLK